MSGDAYDTSKTVTVGRKTIVILSNAAAVAKSGSASLQAESNRVYHELKPDLDTWTGGTIWSSASVLSKYLQSLPVEVWPC